MRKPFVLHIHSLLCLYRYTRLSAAVMTSEPLTTAKVTSSGSQYSVSASGDVTVPNPTPITEALDSECVDPPPEIDFRAMTKTLATIAEALNESAEEAMYPTPPINTPVITSPATSVVYQLYNARSRGMSGMSTFGDRLAQAVSERRNFKHDSDIMSTSSQSIQSSFPADDESVSMSDLHSDGGMARQNSKSAFSYDQFSLIHALSPHRLRLASRQSNGANIFHLQRSYRPASRTFQ